MPALDSHPTTYSGLSNEELFDNYRHEIFSKLSESEMQGLLQETANRLSAEFGMIGSPEISLTNLDSSVYGSSGSGKIEINYGLAIDRQLPDVDDKGNIVMKTVEDANWQILNTVIHETEHAYQDQLIDGTITGNPGDTLAFRANNNSDVAVLSNGSFKLGDAYVNGNTLNGYFIYYFQPTEEAANRLAEIRTSEILNSIAARHGVSSDMTAYNKSVMESGYSATKSMGSIVFNNSSFATDIRNSMINTHLINNDPSILTDRSRLLNVDPAIDTQVRAEMIASRQVRLSAAPENATKSHDAASAYKDMKGKDMNYTAKTPAEYNSMLNNTLNSYYIHAMNDPSMTKEDATKETAAMAERALTAAEEYTTAYYADSNHSADKSISVISSSSSVNSGESSPDIGGLNNGGPNNGGPDIGGAISGGTGSSGTDSGGPDSGGPDSSGPDSGGPDSSGPDSGGPDSGGPGSGGPDSGGDGGVE